MTVSREAIPKTLMPVMPVMPVVPSSGTGLLSPLTELEQKITRILERILDRPHIGRDDTLFALGGDSLDALEFTFQLESIGFSIAVESLLQTPTIAELVRMLAHESWHPTHESLVLLHRGGTAPPLFLVHGWGGDAYHYIPLANRLGSDQPVYGLQAVGLDGRRQRHTQVEEMAAHYVSEIQTIEPHGPYYLGGYSLAGLIVYEMAQQLHQQGREVAMLGMIDTSPTCRVPWQAAVTYPPIRALRAAGHIVRPRLQRWLPWVSSSVFDHYDHAVAAYRARPYAGHIDLFVASGMLSRMLPPFWRRMATGGVHVHPLSSTGHFDIFRSTDSVSELAAAFTRAIASASGKRATHPTLA